MQWRKKHLYKQHRYSINRRDSASGSTGAKIQAVQVALWLVVLLLYFSEQGHSLENLLVLLTPAGRGVGPQLVQEVSVMMSSALRGWCA